MAASPQRVEDCSHSRKSLFFRDRKSNAGLSITDAHPSHSCASC